MRFELSSCTRAPDGIRGRLSLALQNRQGKRKPRADSVRLNQVTAPANRLSPCRTRDRAAPAGRAQPNPRPRCAQRTAPRRTPRPAQRGARGSQEGSLTRPRHPPLARPVSRVFLSKKACSASEPPISFAASVGLPPLFASSAVTAASATALCCSDANPVCSSPRTRGREPRRCG